MAANSALRRCYWLPSAALAAAIGLLYAHTRFGALGPGGGHDHEIARMPGAATAAEEQALYLAPAGRYTAADIAANGPLPASRKYRGFQAKHDFRPAPGDVLCPITRTKAHPECTWIVGGREYRFCCPPCIDELVKLARERPDEVLPPEAFVK